MPQYFYEDSINVRTNSVTILNAPGTAYNAVIDRPVFSGEATTEPVNLQEAKDWCKIDVPDDDTLITRLIKAARIACETYVNLSFITRIVTATIHNGLGNFNLPYGPVVDPITSIKDTDGTVINDYNLRDEYTGDIEVVYNAGYATLPEDLRTALLCQIAFMYENRGDTKKAQSLSLETLIYLKPLRKV